MEVSGKRILVTGVTGKVGGPVARHLAELGAEVWGVARFGTPRQQAELETAGVHTVRTDLSASDLSEVPTDIDVVANFAVDMFETDFDAALRVNAESVGLLAAHCRSAKALFHCSSTAVYQQDGHRHFKETDPLGDNHRAVGMVTYSISKIAAEAVARQVARTLDLPTVIARLNVPYGDQWGWPHLQLQAMAAGREITVHPDGPVLFNPIHEDDIVEMVPRFLDVASVPATVLNWAGVDTVSTEEWCAYLAGMTGLTARLARSPESIASVAVDTSRMVELVGPTRVAWRDGFARMARAHTGPLRH